MLDRLKEVFKFLKKNDVKYIVIGGVAAVIHGVPRATFDIDILIEKNLENAESLLKAFREAGLGTALLTTAEKILSNEITIFKDKVRIDVQISTPGIDFEKAWNNRKVINYQNEEFFILSKKDLIASKKASGREIDIYDAKLLELASDDLSRTKESD